MILSMTGFGEAQREQGGHIYHAEIRSVNNRYFKATIRLPDDLAFLELDLERILRARLTRGSVSLRVHFRDLSESAAQSLNVGAIRQYFEQLRPIGQGDGWTVDLATLALLPGVVQPRELTDSQREAHAAAVMKLAEEALERLMEMRRAEGRLLAEDLAAHCKHIREYLEVIQVRTPHVIAEYRQRLMARIEQLVAQSSVVLAEDDLVREVAIFADRSDISEEISRLRSHLEQFEAGIAAKEPSGRRMDFIAQEMMREANTIGSKAGDAEVARYAIEIKSLVDRIKEQVQNVE